MKESNLRRLRCERSALPLGESCWSLHVVGVRRDAANYAVLAGLEPAFSCSTGRRGNPVLTIGPNGWVSKQAALGRVRICRNQSGPRLSKASGLVPHPTSKVGASTTSLPYKAVVEREIAGSRWSLSVEPSPVGDTGCPAMSSF
jgi:hypothetical protein